MNGQNITRIILLVLGVCISLLLFAVPRTEMPVLMSVFGLSFIAYFLLWRRSSIDEANLSPREWVFWGIGFRFLALFAIPLLSDDYFRFIWDGRLLVNGVNPFLETPASFMANPEQAASWGLSRELFDGLNSKEFFTIYPPVLQGIFSFAVFVFPESIHGSVILMKGFIFLAELGSLFLLPLLLKKRSLPEFWVMLYATNPLIIMELTGNVHFEGVMIFFLLFTIRLMDQKRIYQSTIPFALAVCTKLIPLMALPLLIRRLGWGKAILYGSITGLLTVLLFIPIMDLQTLENMSKSVDLYFVNFEFNASTWYLIREAFQHLTKDNLLEIVGPWLGITTVAGILSFTFLEKKPTIDNLPQGMLWVWGIYFLFASIVHPWYLTTIIALATITHLRWPMIWSMAIILTYATYRIFPYDELLELVLIEYLLVMASIWYDWRRIRQLKKTG